MPVIPDHRIVVVLGVCVQWAASTSEQQEEEEGRAGGHNTNTNAHPEPPQRKQ